MANLTLLQDFNFAATANTAAVGAGQSLLPGIQDVHGGIWSIQAGKLVGTPGGVDSGNTLLLFTAFRNCLAQKIVVTLSGNYQTALAVLRTQATATPPVGYYCQLITSGTVTFGQTVPGSYVDFGGNSSINFDVNASYQLIFEMAANGAGVSTFHPGLFNITTPVTGQPSDPTNLTDTGNTANQTALTDYRALSSQLVSGGFGLATNGSNLVISRVRLYGFALSAQPDFGDHVMTGNQSRGQRLLVTGSGFTPTPAVQGYYDTTVNPLVLHPTVQAGAGSPVFTASFAATAGDTGSSTTIHSQQVISPTQAYVWLDVGTAAGVFSLSSGSYGSTTVNVSAVRPQNTVRSSTYWTGRATARTFDGANSIKFDGSDESSVVQRFLDFCVRFQLSAFWDDDTAFGSKSINLRDPNRYPGEASGGYITGFKLEGYKATGFTSGNGPGYKVTGAGQTCVLEIVDDPFVNTQIYNFGLYGAGSDSGTCLTSDCDTKYGLYFSGCHFTKFLLHECFIRNVGTAVCLDNTVVNPGSTVQGANGEEFIGFGGNWAGRDAVYRNLTLSGQAYPHVIDKVGVGCYRNGASMFHVANAIQGGGNQLMVRDCSCTCADGPLPNVLFEAHHGFDMVTASGGRFEHLHQLLKLPNIGHGYICTANFSDFTMTGAGTPGPLILSYPGGASDTLVNISGINMQASANTFGPLLIQRGASDDNVRIIIDGTQLGFSDLSVLSTNSKIVARSNAANDRTPSADTYKGVSQSVLTAALATAGTAPTEVYLGVTDAQALAGVDAEVFTSVTLLKRVNFTLFGRIYNLEKGQTVSLPATVVSILSQAVAV